MIHFGTMRRREREIVRVMVEAVLAAGWKLDVVDRIDDEVKVTSAAQVLEAVFEVEEARVYFWRERQGDERVEGNDSAIGTWLFFEVGEGDDILTDYGLRLEDALADAARTLGLEWLEA